MAPVLHFVSRKSARWICSLAAVLSFLVSGPCQSGELTAEQKTLHDHLRRDAKDLQSAGKTSEAVDAFEKLLTFERKFLGKGNPEIATTIDRLLRILELDGRFARAVELRGEAVVLAKEKFGDNHWRTGDARRALDHVRKLASLTEAERREFRKAEFAMVVAAVSHDQGDLDDAIGQAREALRIRSTLLGEESQATCVSVSLLGLLLAEAACFEQSRPLCEKTLAIRRRVLGDHHPQTAVSHNNLGYLEDCLGHFTAARYHYEKAVAINRLTLGDTHSATATALNNLGALLFSAGDTAGARGSFEEALAIRSRLFGEEAPATSGSLNSMGVLSHRAGEYAAARSYFQKAIRAKTAAFGERHAELVVLLHNLGLVNRSAGDLRAAQHNFEQALAICKSSFGAEHSATASVLSSLGLLHLEHGDFTAARPLLEQSLAIREKTLGAEHIDTAESLRNLGDWRLYQRQLPEAQPLFERALLVSKKNVALAAAAQSERQQLQMLRLTRTHLDHYLSLALQAGLPAPEVYAHVLRWKGSVFGQQRRLRMVRTFEPASEAGKTFVELEAIANELAKLALSAPNADLPSWRRRVAKLGERKDALEASLARLSEPFLKATTLPTVKVVRSALPANAVLIDYLEFTYHTWASGRVERRRKFMAFVLRADREVVLHDLGDATPIDDAIFRWRGLLARPAGGAAVNDLGAEVKRRIWPLGAPLPEGTIVLVAPDGAVTGVPFAALPGRQPGNFLIEDVSVAVVPFPAFLPELIDKKRPQPTESPALLALGDIDFNTTGTSDKVPGAPPAERWRRLPATRGEIAALRDSFEQRFPKGAVQYLRGPLATETAFRELAPRHDWIHVATHGFFAPAEVASALGPHKGEIDLSSNVSIGGLHPGLLSGLVLAGANRPGPANQDDGILTALEVTQLNLDRVQLAVLSACETGLGRRAGGEGVIGLQRAFQVAGARSVVASLWSVEDDATRRLIERFYENLWGSNCSRLEALSQAQRWMLREGARRGIVRLDLKENTPRVVPPYYWASFILSGDWR